MKTENENSVAEEYNYGDIEENGEFATEEEALAFNLECEETERTARALLKFLEDQNNEKSAVDTTVLSVYRSIIDVASSSNPINFSQILATNTRILNAGFENYLLKAAKHHYSESKTELALRMQSQLIRTISAWSRLKSIQKKFEDRKTK